MQHDIHLFVRLESGALILGACCLLLSTEKGMEMREALDIKLTRSSLTPALSRDAHAFDRFPIEPNEHRRRQRLTA